MRVLELSTIGPPLSPWQESLPPEETPAQNIWLVMAEVPYCCRQVARETIGTVTFRRLTGVEVPPSEVAPLNGS
jgi:hypothetical protein